MISMTWTCVRGVSALLALVLAICSEPLIIGQPEDDLDNPHIYQDVIRVLADVYERRQVIVATHSANIPVLGEAELILALEADAERAHVEAMGKPRYAAPSVAKTWARRLNGSHKRF